VIRYQLNEKGFAGLIGMLVALALICFFVYYMMNNYFKAQVSLPESAGIIPGSGNSPVNYQSIVTNTRDKMEEINKKSLDQLKQVEEAYK
jgi:hypothetical protein